uniref:Extracellular lipase (EC) n=1 Tax=Ganoderma boninense TaxID=34458 RepID=A0A5K1K7U0_9APHY|nr:Extracellular lipase (EC [Ganoderma boninense]
MGRRKIEIQPITRKNGLFKKAYELGVLCSVDVAVIIFEERQGHHAKLYQYCSTDVNGMVQRHIRSGQFDGERDTKGPPDFNTAGGKATEEADDDDEGDDDESSQKRRDSSSSKVPPKVKSENNSNSIVPIRPGPPSANDVSTSADLDYRSNLRVLPKRKHVVGVAPHLRRAALVRDPTRNVGGSPTFPFRIDVDLPSSYAGGVMPSLPQLHPPNPSLAALYPGGSSMGNIMSGPPSSFLSQSPFDLPRGSSGGGGGGPGMRSVPFPPLSHGGAHPYSPHGHQQPPSIFARTSSGAGGGGGGPPGNIFAELLGSPGADHGGGSVGGHGGGGGGGFAPFDWPVHSTQASQQGPQGGHENGPPPDTNWFDFLSGPTATSNGSGAGISLPPPVPPLNSTRFGLGSPGMGRKRLREDSVLSDGMGGPGMGDDEPFSLRRERDSGGLGVNGHGAKRES